MSGIASRAQLRMSFVRWALFTVPGIFLLGGLSAALSGSGPGNRWYQALDKPSINPPGFIFPVTWAILYILIGVALAMILNARGARGRGLALGLFAAQMLFNVLWSPLFFGMHQIALALVDIVLMFACALAATIMFGRIRRGAGWAMVPYLAWLCFAGALNLAILERNAGGTLYVPAAHTHIPLAQ